MQRLTREQLIAKYEPIFEDILREIKDPAREKYRTANTRLQENLFLHFLVMTRRHDLISRELVDAIVGGALDQSGEHHPLPLEKWFDISIPQREATPKIEGAGRSDDAGLIPGRIFLNHEKLFEIQRMRKEGKWDEAEAILLKADPTPAVLDELRKILSLRAWVAKKAGDWQIVIEHLEKYVALADEWRDWCMKTVNQGPPPHTPKDQKLLAQAKEKR